jgi:hypothetical protein
MVMRLKEVPEIRGIHILNGGSDSLMVEAIRQAGMEVSTVGLKFRKRYANA